MGDRFSTLQPTQVNSAWPSLAGEPNEYRHSGAVALSMRHRYTIISTYAVPTAYDRELSNLPVLIRGHKTLLIRA